MWVIFIVLNFDHYWKSRSVCSSWCSCVYTAIFTVTLRKLSRSSFIGTIHIRKNLYQKLEDQQYTYKIGFPVTKYRFFSIIFCSLYDFLDSSKILPRYSTAVHEAWHEARTRVLNLELMHAAGRKRFKKGKLSNYLNFRRLQLQKTKRDTALNNLDVLELYHQYICTANICRCK